MPMSYSPAIRARAIAIIKSFGMAVAAKRTGITSVTLKAWAQEAGIKPPKRAKAKAPAHVPDLSNLRMPELLVMGCLRDAAEEGPWLPSRRAIADAAGLHETTAHRCINRLHDVGMVRCRRVGGRLASITLMESGATLVEKHFRLEDEAKSPLSNEQRRVAATAPDFGADDVDPGDGKTRYRHSRPETHMPGASSAHTACTS